MREEFPQGRVSPGPSGERPVVRKGRQYSGGTSQQQQQPGKSSTLQADVSSVSSIMQAQTRPAWRKHRSRYSLNSAYQFSTYVAEADEEDDQQAKVKLSSQEVAWKKRFKDWDNFAAKTSKFRKAVRGKVPHASLGELWKRLCGVHDLSTKNSGVYESLLQLKSEDEDKIIKDIPRTFPEEEFFAHECNQQAMFNVLKAYSVLDPELGYCQGMNFIVALLLFHMAEEEAFWLLVQMIKTYDLRENFAAGVPELRQNLYIIDRCIEILLPKLFSHFKAQGVTPILFASEWFSTLFVYNFKFHVIYRIWTVFFSEGKHYVYRFAMAILKLLEEQLLGMVFEDIIVFLKEIELDADKLISMADSLPVTAHLVDNLRSDFKHPSTSQYY